MPNPTHDTKKKCPLFLIYISYKQIFLHDHVRKNVRFCAPHNILLTFNLPKPEHLPTMRRITKHKPPPFTSQLRKNMKKFIFKCLISFIAFLAAITIFNHGKLQVLALNRIDPLPHTQELVAAERYAEAESYLGFFMEHEYVSSNPEAAALYQHIEPPRLYRRSFYLSQAA